MPVHLQTTSANVRFYLPGRSFYNYDPFEAIATLQFMGNETVFLSGIHGHINKKFLSELAGLLFGLGMRQLIAERHGKLKTYTIQNFLPRTFR